MAQRSGAAGIGSGENSVGAFSLKKEKGNEQQVFSRYESSSCFFMPTSHKTLDKSVQSGYNKNNRTGEAVRPSESGAITPYPLNLCE